MKIRAMEIGDYHKVYRLWQQIEGFGLRTIDDSEEGITRFLKRNPHTSVVAEEEGEIIGSILCGHDGRKPVVFTMFVWKRATETGELQLK